MEIKEIYKSKNTLINTSITTKGWVRFNRASKNIGFIELTDGTKLNGIQLVYKADMNDFEKLSKMTLFSSIEVKAKLVQGKEEVELLLEELLHSSSPKENFPLGKKEHGLEFLRENAHLRPRTKMFQSIMTIRSMASLAIHEFFGKKGFILINTPIITGNDAEGAGDVFTVKDSNGKDFFDKEGTLTVSGQLHAEAYAQALKKVYTFGPTFRAENSHTGRHASEFWMVEPESTFCDYHEMMQIGWEMISYIINKVLENNQDELKLLSKINERDLSEYLKSIINNDIQKISYKEAIDILIKARENGVIFDEKNIVFGIDLATEHEKYLAGEHFKSPVYVYDYPSEIKSFYMYQNGDGTARGFDLLIPQIGELIGGSQREERYDVLMETLKQKGQDFTTLDWYINLRKTGYVTSSGFGLGFERLVMFLTGTDNIRDVLPFPRTTGKLNF